MEGNLAMAILLAILASTNMNVGKAIQKWKVKVLAHGRQMFSPEHRRDFRIWTIGIALTVTAAPIFSFALNHTDRPSMVSSMNGVGMIGLVLFAWLVLKERIGLQEIAGAVLVFIGTTIMGVFEEQGALSSEMSVRGFLLIFLICLAVFSLAALIAWKTKKLHGLCFGVLVGFLMGSAVILGKMALVEAGHSFWGQLKNPYVYFALLSGLGALILTQLAFWRSTAMVVVPTINSVMIISPVAIEYFTFMKSLKTAQYAAIAAIVVGVILLTATEKVEKIEGKKKGEDESQTIAGETDAEAGGR